MGSRRAWSGPGCRTQCTLQPFPKRRWIDGRIAVELRLDGLEQLPKPLRLHETASQELLQVRSLACPRTISASACEIVLSRQPTRTAVAPPVR